MAESISNNKRIAKNSILLSVRMVFVMAISLYISRITLHNLGVEDFGIYNVVCGFVTMFAFLSAAMTSAIQRFYNFEYGRNGALGGNSVFITALQSQTLLAIIVIVILESVGLWYINTKMVIPADRFDAALIIFHISIISMVVSMYQSAFDAAIMAHERMGFYAFLSILNQILKLAIVIVLPFLSKDKLVVYAILFLLVTILDLLVSIIYCVKNFPEIRLRLFFSRSLLKEMFVFCSWNILGKFSLSMKEQGLNMLLNLFYGPVVNAARGLAFQVTGALNGFVSNVSVAVKPQLTQSYAQGDIKRTLQLMFSNTKVGYIILYLLSLPVCLEIDFILRIWLGDSVPPYTNTFVIIVFLITLLNGMQGNVSFVIHATGQLKLYSIVTSIITLLVVPLSYVMLWLEMSPNSVFWVSLFVTFINYIFSVILLNRIVPFSIMDYSGKVIFPLLMMSVVSFPIPYCLHRIIECEWMRLCIVFALSMIIIALTSFCFVLTKEEQSILLQLITRNKVKKRG